MNKAFLLKYGEIALKGKNRRIFEDVLVKRIKEALSAVEGRFEVSKPRGRIFVELEEDFDEDEVISALQRVFGIVWICPVVLTEDLGFEDLAEKIVNYVGESLEEKHISFKVDARRARKNYPLTSMEINAALGEKLLDAFPEMRVDVHDPDMYVRVEIREKINFYIREIPGPGGMPIGTNGSAQLLLSGGIDSPVAGYMVARRGVNVHATYFHAPPYTSERAKQKVVDLARILSRYIGPVTLHVVNFTDIQMYIYETCPHDELTILMRRYMMRIAEHFAREDGDMGLVTGESIGQVASQTMQSLACTDAVVTMPVYRPLIGFDKQDIIDRALLIDTYETSILPYEDCCTIFVAKHPVTRPRLERIERSEAKLVEKIDDLVATAIETTETIECRFEA
ncbi:MAG: tRNA 4-thiouridine(8) synthase ThiI [Lachnospiraceae bacterium]|nr:tRNA 4-thiouridine(8) synthase ThiI [Lachnospiraceae bacterium]